LPACVTTTFSGIDLKLTADGYLVQEANSGPVYLDIELKTGAPLTETIVELLPST
jgi:glutathione synthase/RimK-type ligase-like ATP-grasp enzyme